MTESGNFEGSFSVPLTKGAWISNSLVAKDYMVNGINGFYTRDAAGDKSLVAVTALPLLAAQGQLEKSNLRDPGPLVVDDFLTEEDEAKILESLQDDTSLFQLTGMMDIARRATSLPLKSLGKCCSRFARLFPPPVFGEARA